MQSTERGTQVVPIMAYGGKEQIGRTTVDPRFMRQVAVGLLIDLKRVRYCWTGAALVEWYPPHLNRRERRTYDAQARRAGRLRDGKAINPESS